MRRLGLLACLLLPALARAQAPGAPEPPKCEFPVYGPEFPEGMPADDARCARIRAYKDVFVKLRDAASFTDEELKFFVTPVLALPGAPNAVFHGPMSEVSVNWGFVEGFAPGDAAVATMLAHEVGHAVQFREGWIPRTYGEKLEQSSADARRAEAHADLVGRELMQRAGFEPSLVQAGQERVFGCAVIQAGMESARRHPAPSQRWLNSVRANSPNFVGRVERAARELAEADPEAAAAHFDGSTAGPGAYAVPKTRAPEHRGKYFPSHRLGDLDTQGRLIGEKILLLDPRLMKRPSIVDLARAVPPPPPEPVRHGPGPLAAAAFPRIETMPDALRPPTGTLLGWTLDVARRTMEPRVVLEPGLVREDDERVAAIALRACGAGTPLTYWEAVRRGLDQISGEAALSLKSWLSEGRP